MKPIPLPMLSENRPPHFQSWEAAPGTLVVGSLEHHYKQEKGGQTLNPLQLLVQLLIKI